MTKRKSISKRVRFEIFKRDKFTCQYCGRKSPDIILEIDHLEPVSKGGNNALINLLTSCEECNSGKSDKRLDDGSMVLKQRLAAEIASDKIEQVKLLAKWHKELACSQDAILEEVINHIQSNFACFVNENGRVNVKKWIKRYPISVLFESIEACAHQYIQYDDGKPDKESVNKAFAYIPRVASVKSSNDPNRQQIAYIAGILRNRLYYVNEREYRELMRSAVACGCDLADIRQEALECRNWTQFYATVEEIVNTAHG